MIKISCTKADATLLATETLTSGSQGRTCQFEFNEDWNGLGKVAVCKAGETKLTVMIVGNQITIPDECFEEPRVNLIIGVYGTDATKIVIPTIWCAVGLIQLGTDPDISENIGDITPTLAEQVIEAADTALTKSVIAADAEIGQGVHGPLAPAEVTVTKTEVSEGGEQGTTLHFSFDNIVGEQGRYASITGQTKAHTYGDTPSLTATGTANVSLTVDFPDAESIEYDESANHTDGSVADALYDNTVAHNNMLTSIGQKEDKSNKVTSISSSSTDTQYPSAKAVNTALGTKENTSNKVSSWSTTPNNTNYPSEKLVKDNLNRIDNELDSLSDQIESEIGRATSAEEELENDIETEATRAQTAETTLQSNITSEASRAAGAESGIQSALDAHKARTDNPHSVTKSQVGLGNVDNTSDVNKPVSTATQTALNLKANAADLTSHINNHSNPHSVTKTQVGLGNVDNTSDLDKPISTATQTELTSQSTRIAQLEATIEEQAEQIDALEAKDAEQDDRLKFLEAVNEGKTFITETDSDEAYSKTIKSNVIPEGNKALVQSIGGKSRTTRNIMPNISDFDQTVNGVHIYCTNGIITLDGTSTDSIGIRVSLPDTLVIPAGSHLHVRNQSTNYGIALGLLHEDFTQFTYASFGSPVNKIVSLDDSADEILGAISLSVPNAGTVCNISAAPSIEMSNESTPFEPHFDGIRSAQTEQIVSDGFNLWDEEWTTGGLTNSGVLNPDPAATQIASTNYIPCESGIKYYFGYASIYKVCWYDSNKVFISLATNVGNTEQQAPDNAKYFRFNTSTAYGGTYRNNININISNSFNGQYKPYVGTIDTISIPDQLRIAHPLLSAPNAYDEYHLDTLKMAKKVGTRAHQEGDEDDATVITDGTTTQYPLSEIVETDISTYFPEGFTPQIEVESGGSVTFEQTDTEFLIPNTISYLRKVVTT